MRFHEEGIMNMSDLAISGSILSAQDYVNSEICKPFWNGWYTLSKDSIPKKIFEISRQNQHHCIYHQADQIRSCVAVFVCVMNSSADVHCQYYVPAVE